MSTSIDHTFSIIVPFHQFDQKFELAIDAILALDPPANEIIAVYDGRLPNNSESKKGVAFHSTDRSRGPAYTRNLGAKQSTSDYLVFIDSDVLVKPTFIARLKGNLKTFKKDYSAFFGSYDSDPYERDFLSQYRNLLHHYVHQNGNAEANTFWSGCGIIKRKVFLEVGGFDHIRFTQPSIEDIDLGYKLKAKGYSIRLLKDLQVKHLKKWSFANMLRTDLFCRAIPWSALLLDGNQFKNDLNIDHKSRISVLLVLLILLTLITSIFMFFLLYIVPFLIIILLAFNHGQLLFFINTRGMWFALKTVPLTILHYFISGLGFFIALVKK